MPPLPCAAVVFDFDGVIVDSTAIKTAALLELYRPHGAEVQAAVGAFHRLNAGLSRTIKLRHVEEHVLGRSPDDAAIAALAQRLTDMMEDQVVACPSIPGADEFLRRHAGRLPMFVASGTPEDELQRIVAKRGLAGVFVEVRGSPIHKRELIRDLITRHDLDVTRTVMVGDALTDLEAAQVNGLAFVGIVPEGEDNLFPAGEHIRRDLTDLEDAIAVVLDRPRSTGPYPN